MLGKEEILWQSNVGLDVDLVYKYREVNDDYISSDENILNVLVKRSEIGYNRLKNRLTFDLRGPIISIEDKVFNGYRVTNYSVLPTKSAKECLHLYDTESVLYYIDREGNLRGRSRVEGGYNFYTFRYRKSGVSQRAWDSFLESVLAGEYTSVGMSSVTGSIGKEYRKRYWWNGKS